MFHIFTFIYSLISLTSGLTVRCTNFTCQMHGRLTMIQQCKFSVTIDAILRLVARTKMLALTRRVTNDTSNLHIHGSILGKIKHQEI